MVEDGKWKKNAGEREIESEIEIVPAYAGIEGAANPCFAKAGMEGISWASL